MRIYLARPEVFHPDAVRLGGLKKALCAQYGFTGLYPLDGTLPKDGRIAATIYAKCLAMMHDAHFGIFNLTPFRGPSADVGTAFELGAMAAAGKPVFAYSNVEADLIDRLRIEGLRQDAVGGAWRDADGMMVEHFGNADNLMLDETLAAQGRRVHRLATSHADRFTDMGGFVACLEDAGAAFGSTAPPAA